MIRLIVGELFINTQDSVLSLELAEGFLVADVTQISVIKCFNFTGVGMLTVNHNHLCFTWNIIKHDGNDIKLSEELHILQTLYIYYFRYWIYNWIFIIFRKACRIYRLYKHQENESVRRMIYDSFCNHHSRKPKVGRTSVGFQRCATINHFINLNISIIFKTIFAY